MYMYYVLASCNKELLMPFLSLDESAKRLLDNHREMTRFYREMYQNVVKINSSVSDLMSAVNTMQAQLDKKIAWFTQVMGSSGKVIDVQNITLLKRCMQDV